ncbi:hydroxymethylglutaryl-CoA lyase [Malassezia brasiliensis]|uniref:Hydroxymethylglutaryl-CoA lyase n=1 Tax=Malassezia brasiliensis TaxID=1821822 RepID=A0AAF0IPY2_9BASI|nr:hydroxymethylglutaryl-CoA lyase [Malassezia brasiliensis]
MTTIVDIPFALPAAPANYQPAAASTSAVSLTTSKLEPAGAAFLGYMRRSLRQSSFADDDALVQQRLADHAAANAEVDELDNDIGEEPESEELLASDPKEWKQLDHYAVLGLSGRRYKATEHEIKIAHRKKVLKHHPDKKVGSSGLSDDSFFKCVAKSFEILSNPEKRRQFDSVDEGIDDDAVPTGKEAPERFFELWGPVFEREARFSKETPVPSLGDANSTKQEVDEFYNFFYNFDSWRSFEYLDKEVNEGSDSRDEKRYTEKKNRNERARRKKEDNARLRNIVDKALSVDPRIKQFRAQERAAREAKKNKGRPTAAANPRAAAIAEAEKRKAEAEKAAAEAKAKEEAEKAEREAAKKQREAAKKNLKKEKKALRTIVQNANYFQPAGTSPSAAVLDKQLGALDALAAALQPEEVVALREACEKGTEAAKEALNKACQDKSLGDAFA